MKTYKVDDDYAVECGGCGETIREDEEDDGNVYEGLCEECDDTDEDTGE